MRIKYLTLGKDFILKTEQQTESLNNALQVQKFNNVQDTCILEQAAAGHPSMERTCNREEREI